MFEIKELHDLETAKRIAEFMTSENVFEQEWTPNEKENVTKAVLRSIDNPNHQYWYIEDKGEIIAAIGVCENKYGSNGFQMDEDYAGVHKAYRRNHLATGLLEKMESFVREKNGRYIHILCCDIPSYEAARKFWLNAGYTKVAEIPNYYVPGEGRVDYYKELR